MCHSGRSRVLFAIVACLSLGSTACKPKPAPQTAPAIEPSVDTAGRADADSARIRAARDAAERERARLESERAERERIDRVMSAPIYFALDRSDLDAAARATLEAKLAVLRANPGRRLRMDGHGDERGSSEYNFALGMRRAAAARRYLMQRDIAGERLDTGSHGEASPVCEEATEACWRLNRRVEFMATPR